MNVALCKANRVWLSAATNHDASRPDKPRTRRPSIPPLGQEAVWRVYNCKPFRFGAELCGVEEEAIEDVFGLSPRIHRGTESHGWCVVKQDLTDISSLQRNVNKMWLVHRTRSLRDVAMRRCAL